MRTTLSLFFAALFVLSVPLAAQQAAGSGDRQTWAAAGLGAGAMSGDGGGIISLELAHQWDEQLLMLAIGGVFDLYDEAVGDLGVLYGRARTGPTFHSFAAVGLAATEGDAGESTIGVPIRLGASWRPVPILGIGIRTLANLNTVGSYVGFALVLEVGDLR